MFACSQRSNARRVRSSRHNFTKENTDNVESFTLIAKLNAISKNLSFLLRACVQNEVTGIHKFYRREIFFIGTFYASFSYELRARIKKSELIQGSEKLEVTLFFAFDRCKVCLWLFQFRWSEVGAAF